MIQTIVSFNTECRSEWFHQTRQCRFVWHGIRETYPLNTLCQVSNEIPGSFKQWTIDAFVKKIHSLHFNCWNMMDWRELVITWRNLRGILYNHSDIMFINPEETINKWFIYSGTLTSYEVKAIDLSIYRDAYANYNNSSSSVKMWPLTFANSAR